jgi:glycosyltransferase involved in cell wall biosynthesis
MSAHGQFDVAYLTRVLSTVTFVGFRWESPYTPCTGITAVFKQERSHFQGRAAFIAPWCPRMAAAAKALADGKVVPVPDAEFFIQLGLERLRVQILTTTDAPAPIFYLHFPDDGRAFAGTQTPYDTPHMERDTFLFALAAEQVLARFQPAERVSLPFVWAADWQCVPAMTRLHWNRVTCLHLHNLYDTYLGDAARALGYDDAHAFEGRSVLSAGFANADVVATVSRGFAEGIRRELLHTAIFAPHLQAEAWRIQPVENANFMELDPALQQIADALENDLPAGAALLTSSKKAARKKLPPEIQSRIEGKTIIVSMGRAATQKLHCAVVESAERLLQTEWGKSVFLIFATTDSDRDDQIRQAVIAAFAAQHPEAAAACTGRIPFFGDLMRAADLNVMASLWEPFGGAYEGTILPVARAIDGLASQIHAHAPSDLVRAITGPDSAPPTGWLFREALMPSAHADLTSLLTAAVPTTRNATFAGIVDACAATLASAVALHQKSPLEFAGLVRNALHLQRTRTWQNYDRMVDLASMARVGRGLA